jgi:hypothetical protein
MFCILQQRASNEAECKSVGTDQRPALLGRGNLYSDGSWEGWYVPPSLA